MRWQVLTFKLGSVRRAMALIQQTIHVILQQAITLQDCVHINVVVLGGVFFVVGPSSTRCRAEKNNQRQYKQCSRRCHRDYNLNAIQLGSYDRCNLPLFVRTVQVMYRMMMICAGGAIAITLVAFKLSVRICILSIARLLFITIIKSNAFRSGIMMIDVFFAMSKQIRGFKV